jgi:hypothetical protein
MPRTNFNYFALHYLNLWLTYDREFCEALQRDDEARKLKALSDAATFYKVARNLPKACDVGEGFLRYTPVLDVIDAQDPSTFQEPRLISSIYRVHNQISEKYRRRGVTSLATKFLWLKMKVQSLSTTSEREKRLARRQTLAAITQSGESSSTRHPTK